MINMEVSKLVLTDGMQTNCGICGKLIKENTPFVCIWSDPKNGVDLCLECAKDFGEKIINKAIRGGEK